MIYSFLHMSILSFFIKKDQYLVTKVIINKH